jgi:FkbM family methyltransferase
VYDIGVHRGYLTMIVAHCVGSEGTVIAFEPNPGHAQTVETTLALNPDLAARIRLEHAAVSDTSGTVIFSGGAGQRTGRIVDSHRSGYPVRAVSLNDYVNAANPLPNVIKMDIEGAESRALRAIDCALARRPVLFVELHDAAAAAAISQLAVTFGYRIRLLNGEPFDGGFKRRIHVIATPLVQET